MIKVEKQSIPIFFNNEGEPIAALVNNKRQRIIYTLREADEDEIVNLIEKQSTLKQQLSDDREQDKFNVGLQDTE